ncbi:MAG TPA: 4-hydroxythreonine-4-phosphate dehydrogenase PdxA [Candidatus Sulfopaludibacter sp.]|nr:4-hydroxythreonine-4-phosphate dehydrogenase PdxA [Candidatus Sulfopaludibacter sp.]
MTRWIGITLGDVTGIGPEVTLKALAAEPANDDTRYLLMGDEGYVHRLNEKLGIRLPLEKFSGCDAVGVQGSACSSDRLKPELQPTAGRFFVAQPFAEPLPENLPAGSPAAAEAAIAALKHGAKRCLRGELAAVVTAPVNKQAIVRAGHKFVGQTELFAKAAKTKRYAMMLLGHDEQERWLRVTLVTIHTSIKSVPRKITPEKITLAVELAVQACRDLGLARAKIAVCGLNPHAGEGGEFGNEEIKAIAPTILAAQKSGLDVVGPLSGDTVFYYALRGDFDAVVAMYHDQGLAPLKAVAFDTGVNWTLGLPFIRTSPDHGTAYDIAGKGIANPSSMVAAIRLAKQLAKNKRWQSALGGSI